MKKAIRRTLLVMLALVMLVTSNTTLMFAAVEAAPVSTAAAKTLTIHKQPASVKVASGAAARVTVSATGSGLKYQWYIKDKGNSAFTHSSSTTGSTYSVKMTDARNGRQVYCVVIDKNGTRATTRTATLSMAAELTITQQPKNVTVLNGKVAATTIKATGEGTLRYQWYLCAKNGDAFYKSSVVTPKYDTVMSNKVNGRQLYCVVTDNYGQKAVSRVVTFNKVAAPVITKNPKDAYAVKGNLVSVSVQAAGQSALKYQWYVMNAGGDKFYKSSVTGSTYVTKMTDAVNGRQVYCVVTDNYGQTVASQVAVIRKIQKLTITKQPQTAKVLNGKTATVSVKATGQGSLSYQWYVAASGSSKYYKSSVTSATYKATMTKARNGRKVYCVITDSYGQKVTTNAVTIGIAAPLTITKEPKNAIAANGALATVKMGVTGEGKLTYTWYVRNKGGEKFYPSSVTGASYTTKMTNAVDGRQVYCVITDTYGRKVQTQTVTLRKAKALTITQQPVNTKAGNGVTASVPVKATGDGKLTYTWYVAKAGSNKFEVSANSNSTYKVVMNSSRNGYRVYCVISDNYGQKVKTATATLRMAAPIVITGQPTDAKVLDGDTVKASAAATGDGKLTYTWYFAEAGSDRFYKSSVSSATYKAVMNSDRDGRRVYCRITDNYGQSVDTVTVTLRKVVTLRVVKIKDGVAYYGDIAKVNMEMESEKNVTYTWYIRNKGGVKFYKASATGSSYSALMSETVEGREVYCVIADTYGQTVQTDVVVMRQPKDLVIVQEPQDITIMSGKSATMEVILDGEEDLTFTWYIRNKGNKKFYPSAVTGDSYSPIMSSAVDGREAYCVIRDNFGHEVTTRVATFTKDLNGKHILIVGNSHSLDAFWLLRTAYMDQNPESDLFLGILYYSGGNISEHVVAANNNEAVNRYYKNSNGKWVIEHNVTHERVLTDQEWDVVLIQPGKEDIVKTNPDLNKKGRDELKAIIDNYIDNPFKFYWHITWPCPQDEYFFSPDYIRQPPEGYQQRLIDWYDFSSLNQYAEKLDMTNAHIVNDPMFDGSLCSGAAVMQAYMTQNISQQTLYRDYTHLNDYGRLLVAYSLVAQITGKPVENVGVDVVPVRSRFYLFTHLGDLEVTQEMKDIIIEAANYSLEYTWVMPQDNRPASEKVRDW